MRPLTVMSLFAGIGGIELGLERAGMTTVAQVEMDPYCQQVLAKHWPEVPRHDDVRTTPDWWHGAPRPRVDVVCGGFPCQPFSVAGKQLGTADERWGWPWDGRRHSLSTTPIRAGGERRSARSRWRGFRSRPRRPSRPRVRCGMGFSVRVRVRRPTSASTDLPAGLPRERAGRTT